MVASQNTVRQKKENAAKEANTLRPLLQLIIRRTKELQSEVLVVLLKICVIASFYIMIQIFL